MKKLLTFLSFITLFSTFSYSQISQDLSYQSIVRYANGNIVVSTDVEVDLAITSNGVTVYSESHTATTSKKGLVSLRLGSKIYLHFQLLIGDQVSIMLVQLLLYLMVTITLFLQKANYYQCPTHCML